ncbi:MAG: hypothetical protein M3457_03450, partial [Chloroflexota bacterium]|nr:hypothetical protein [Chloroflexota bacterium]
DQQMIPYAAVDALRSIRRTLHLPRPATGTPDPVPVWHRLATFLRRQSSGFPVDSVPAGQRRQEGAYDVDTQPGA